jgi:hypothetical protein
MAIGRDEPVPQSAGDNSSGAEQINVPQCTAPAPAQEQQREGIDGYTRTTVGEDGFHREYIFVPNPQPVPQSVGTEGTLTHGRCCSSGFDLDADCTCGLQWRIQLQTEQEMHNAWRKRAEEAEAACAEETRQFKNFHRNLCERFNYCHDEIDWKRDQASLEEHIAEARKGLHSEAEIEKALQDEVEQWPGYESWYKCFTKDVLARLNAHKEERVTVEKEMR